MCSFINQPNTENLKAPPHHDFFFNCQLCLTQTNCILDLKNFHILYEKRNTVPGRNVQHMINQGCYYHQDRQHSTAIKNTWLGFRLSLGFHLHLQAT